MYFPTLYPNCSRPFRTYKLRCSTYPIIFLNPHHPRWNAELCCLLFFTCLFRLFSNLLRKVSHFSMGQTLNFYPPFEIVFSEIQIFGVFLQLKHHLLDQDIRHPSWGCPVCNSGSLLGSVLPTLTLDARVFPVDYHLDGLAGLTVRWPFQFWQIIQNLLKCDGLSRWILSG